MLLLHLISCTFHELEKVHKLARGKHFSVMACHTGYSKKGNVINSLPNKKKNSLRKQNPVLIIGLWELMVENVVGKEFTSLSPIRSLKWDGTEVG